MPSAANSVKVDKQIGESGLGDNSTPLRQGITVIEHKIRNLEKRKSKLESYQELQRTGKTLNDDQKTAVAKYNEVIQTLEFARDLCKQFVGIVAVTEKEAKKQAKREASQKAHAELARLREILLVQDALTQMGIDTVREDFLHGRNGAAQLSETDLKLLDDLYPAITPKHEAGNPTAFTNEVQTAAEHLLAVVDGKQKDVFGGTYCQIKEILGKIHESGYFDQAQVFESYIEPEITEQPELAPEEPAVVDQNLDQHQPQQMPVLPPQEVAHQMPPMEALSIENMPPIIQHPAGPMPPVMEVIPSSMVPPHVQEQMIPPPEAMYYQQAPPVQVQPQPPRPISEVLGTGSFFFLQESEIEPGLDQIPTQTYTNQQFVAGVHPPPPIPLPQQFHPQIPAQIPNNLPPNVNALNAVNMNEISPAQLPVHQNTPPMQVSPPKNGNTYMEDSIRETKPKYNEPKYNDDSRNKKYPPRNSYYQNNGYKDNSRDNYNKEYREPPRDNFTKENRDGYNKDYKDREYRDNSRSRDYNKDASRDNYNKDYRPRQNRNGNPRQQNRH